VAIQETVAGRRRLVLIVLLLMIFGALAIGYLLTFHLDTVRRMVQQQMTATFGKNLKVDDVHVTFFPTPRLTLTNLQIFESEDGPIIFTAKQVHMDLSFFSVMQDEIVPNSLLIQEPEVFVQRNEQGQWNIESSIQSQFKGPAGAGALLADYALTIENGRVQIIDAFEKTQPETVNVSEIAAHLSNLSLSGPIDIYFSAILNDDSASTISFEGTLSDIHALLAPKEKIESGANPTFQARSHVELTESNVFTLARMFHMEDFIGYHTGEMTAQSHIRFAPSLHGYELILSDVLILSDALDVHGQVSISGLMRTEPPTISITWANAPIPIQKVLKAIPKERIPEEFRSTLDELPLDGKVEVISATVSGSNREDVDFSIIGELKVSEGLLNLGKDWGKADHIQGTVVIQPDRVQLKDFEGKYDSISVSSASGEIEFRDHGPWLSTQLQGEVPSKKLFAVLRKVFGWTDPNHAMSKFAGVSGSGNMTIQLAGPLTQLQDISVQQAKYDVDEFDEVDQVVAHVPGIEGPIKNLSGIVTFSQDHVGFEPLHGVLGDSPFSLEGGIKFQNAAVFDSLRLTGDFSVTDLAAQLERFSIPLRDVVSGTTTLATLISGPLDGPVIQTKWKLGNLEMQMAGVLRKQKGVEGVLETDLEFAENGNLNIRRLVFSLPPLTLSGKGIFSSEKKSQVSATVSLAPVNVEAVPPGLILLDQTFQKGIMELSLKIAGEGNDWRLWDKYGWLALSQGMLIVEGLDRPLSDILLRAKFGRHAAEIQRLQFRIENSQAGLSGIIQNWDTKPNVKFEMVAPRFNIDLLIPEGERSPLRDVLESVAASQTVEGTLKFDQAWYKNIQFQGLRGRLRIKNGLIGVDQISGHMEPGNVQGRFLIHLPRRQPASMRTWIDLDNVPLQPLETTFWSKKSLSDRFITGNLSVEGTVQGNGKDPRGIVPTLNGKLKVLMRDGRVQRGTVIPKMLALMNLPSVLQGKVDLQNKGYPFDKQSATLNITNGKMTSEDIVMDGPILKLSGAGQYDLVEDQLDLAIAASPLGPYFDLLRKIPLFQLLLEGEQKGIDMAIFRVKGSLNDPNIEPLPLESFKSGLTGFASLAFNVLKNTVTLPTNILFPKQSEESQPLPSE